MASFEGFLALCGAIGIVGGAGAVIYKVFLPAGRLVKRVRRLEEKADRDYATINAMVEADRVICATLLVLLDHAITGNDFEKLKEQRKVLDEYLVSR